MSHLVARYDTAAGAGGTPPTSTMPGATVPPQSSANSLPAKSSAAGHEIGVDALLEAVAGLAANARVQLGAENARAGEVGGFEHDAGGLVVHLGVDAAEDTGDDQRPLHVGDDEHLVVERALHAVEGDDLLPRRRPAGDQLVPADLGRVERV